MNKEKNFIAIGDIAGFIALSTISYENLALITFSNNIAFPDTVTQIVFDNQELKNNIRRIFEKLDARQAQEQEQHIFWMSQRFKIYIDILSVCDIFYLLNGNQKERIGQ